MQDKKSISITLFAWAFGLVIPVCGIVFLLTALRNDPHLSLYLILALVLGRVLQMLFGIFVYKRNDFARKIAVGIGGLHTVFILPVKIGAVLFLIHTSGIALGSSFYWMLYLLLFGWFFWAAFTWFFTRPQVKEQFKNT